MNVIPVGSMWAVSDDLISGDSPADAAYRWSIRIMYGAAIALNVWVLWDMVADDADTQKLKNTLGAWKARLLRPFHLEQQVQRETGPMIWEAMRIVEEMEGEPPADE